MLWELSGDTDDAELLRSAYHSLHHPLNRRVFAKVATPYPLPSEPSTAPDAVVEPAPVTPTF